MTPPDVFNTVYFDTSYEFSSRRSGVFICTSQARYVMAWHATAIEEDDLSMATRFAG